MTPTPTDDDLQAIPDWLADLLVKWDHGGDGVHGPSLVSVADRLAALRKPRFQPGDKGYVEVTATNDQSPAGSGAFRYVRRGTDQLGYWRHDEVRTPADLTPTPPPDDILRWADERAYVVGAMVGTVARWILDTYGNPS